LSAPVGGFADRHAYQYLIFSGGRVAITRATSSCNGGRDHSGMLGDIVWNQQLPIPSISADLILPGSMAST
ncbi:hypothetical protein, partial [Bradyrhizobium sp.]|uniref:hypothetical protein n=1 Tax=Bradyrhizobium sp. TaxID=376 RepID=UPI003C4E4084